MVEIKPPTVLKSEERRKYEEEEEDFYVDYNRNNDEEIIETLEDVKLERRKLFTEFSQLEKRMSRGIDVSSEFAKLKKKFELIKEIENTLKESEKNSREIFFFTILNYLK